MTRPIPMIDDLALDHVVRAHHRSTQRLAAHPVLGLDGDAQAHLGRCSHEIELAGVVIGEEARQCLAELQEKAAAGEEASFTADIATALSLEKVVIASAEFLETAGRPGRYDFRLLLRESPPLPEPAEVAPFGGLDGFDLGFDTDMLGDIADAADRLQDAVEAVGDVLEQLDTLAGLGDLALGNPLTPIQEKTDEVGRVGGGAGDAAASLGRLLRGES